MNELFKLKKDGKTVGYLRFNGACARYSDPKTHKNLSQREFESLPHINCSAIDLRLFPFVTKDKNGKDVFAGDKMQSKDRLRKYEVVWNERQCNWFLRGLSTSWAVNEPTWKDYELIEDKDDE